MGGLRIAVLDCGLPGITDLALSLETLGETVHLHADTRLARDSLPGLAPDTIMLGIRGPVNRWLFRIRQFAARVPVAVIHDQDLTSSEVLRLLAAGVSVLLKATATAGLVQKSLSLAKNGYTVISRPLLMGNTGALVTRAPLTAREVEVLRLVSRGKSNAEIARDLFIAEVTVRNHLSNIFKKTGFRNRTSAGMAFTLAELLAGEPLR
jgi:DNA-binding NarL/FixJ family response regulator